MIRIVSLLTTAFVGLGLQIAPLEADIPRSFVSTASGNDANACSWAAPCRQAAAKSDGEIAVLDAGGYGSLTFMKSVSIVNDGVGRTVADNRILGTGTPGLDALAKK